MTTGNTPTDPERRLFDQALDQPAGPTRDAWLAHTCAGDPALEARVRALLWAHEDETTFLPSEGTGPAGNAPSEQAGDLIGRYKLLQQIGEGGFGTVWMAEQTEPVTRRVALKIIKLGMDTREVIARFEQERQALAMMDHPNIAKVYDAGATDTGRPFFVMELVKGVPITQYCDEAGLGTRERLALFRDVCSAIQHAHQKGIIHRDIKPSNVMVTMHGDKAVVKVIDFGIAKATQGRLTDLTLFTRFDQFIGTPVYMSPEQASLSGLDIDTRSDIYSLGILLYELLTGKPPFDAKSLLSAGYDEMRRIICEVEPPKPSSRLSTVVGEERTTLAKARQIDPDKLKRLIEPDLDWIVMKAIEKDRTRRYETANGLAMDLQRFLTNEPVSATPPTAGYKFRKFARRNKAALRVAAGIAAVLVAATAVSVWQAKLARDSARDALAARNEATATAAAEKTAREEAELVSAFLTDVFKSPDPDSDGKSIKAVDLLERATRKLTDPGLNQTYQDAIMQATLANTYVALGLPLEAVSLSEKAQAYCLARLGPLHRNTLAARATFAHVCFESGRREEAVRIQEELLLLSRRKYGQDDGLTISLTAGLARYCFSDGQLEKAMKLSEEAMKFTHATKGPDHPGTLLQMSNLGRMYQQAGKVESALKLLEEAVPLSRRVNGPRHSTTILAISNLARCYSTAGRHVEALRQWSEALSLSREVYGPEHPATFDAMHGMAAAYNAAGKNEEAIRMQEELLAGRREVLRTEHPSTVDAINNLGTFYQKVGRRDKAIPLFEELVAITKKVLGPEHPKTLYTMSDLAHCYYSYGMTDKEQKLDEELLTLCRKAYGPEHRETLRAMQNLANLYSKIARHDEAIRINLELLAVRRRLNGPENPQTLDIMSNLAVCYGSAGKHEEEINLLEERLGITRKVNGPDHPDTVMAMNNLFIGYAEAGTPELAMNYVNELANDGAEHSVPVVAAMARVQASTALKLLAEHQWSEAELMLRESLGVREKIEPGEWTTANTKSMLGGALAGQKRFTEAEPFLVAGGTEMLERKASIPEKGRQRLNEALERLVVFYESAGRPEEGTKWKEELAANRWPDAPNITPGADGTDGNHTGDAPLKPPPAKGFLVSPDSEWKWLHPTNGVDPAVSHPDFHTTFFAADYDDSAWQTGQDSDGPTGGFGYGDEGFTGVDIGTPDGEQGEMGGPGQMIRYGAYFRHRFTTDKPYTHLELRCRRDDGIIVYLDGKEVGRDNMSEGQNSWKLPAQRALNTGEESIVIRIPFEGITLPAGEHILAISVHNPAGPSSDLRIGGIMLVEVEPSSSE